MEEQLPFFIALLGKAVPDQMIERLAQLRLVADIAQALQHLTAGKRADQLAVAVHNRQEVDPLPHHDLRRRSQRGLQRRCYRAADHCLFNALPFLQLLHITPAYYADNAVPLIRHSKALLPAGERQLPQLANRTGNLQRVQPRLALQNILDQHNLFLDQPVKDGPVNHRSHRKRIMP
ncbi:hypothetical protein D3C75_365920 [compost metagenome]